MIKTAKIILLICFIAALTGCASIDFYEVAEDGTEKETGFLYYPAKPFLLVEMKDENIATKIISLPNLSRPHRVKQNNGWGAAELGFEIENGMIKSFNSKTDSKAPETISSLAGLGSAKAEIETAKAATLAVELAAANTIKMVGVGDGKQVEIAANYKVKVFEKSYISIKDEIIPALNKNSAKFKIEIETLSDIQNQLKNNKLIDYKPLDPDALLRSVEDKRKLAKILTIKLKNVSATLDIYASNAAKLPNLVMSAKNANTPLKTVIKALSAFSLRSSNITGLYEIKYINGQLNLRKVLLQ